ncbi:MAG: acetyl-CoA C-acyltransferase, partial [Vicinamibacterales bacterium]
LSHCPTPLPRVREGLRQGNGQVIASMLNDGLWCPYENWHMGNAGETVAETFTVSRDEQDQYSVESHQKAAAAHKAGKFAAEILPVSIPQRKGDPIAFDRDESVREDTTAEVLRRLKPAFRKDGTVTAGNAPPVNDGAAALVVMSADRAAALGLTPIARIVAQATSGLEPKMLLMTPVEATRKVATKAGWAIDDIDLIELNEAFAVQAIAVMRELGVDPARVNVNGGAVALGHAIGSSGARVLTTLLYALKDRGKKKGVATLCLGGGNGVALAVELL